MQVNQLNYHHLLYVWMTAKEGSIQGAAQRLRLAHPTISGQIKQFEASIGHKLFRRQGRGVVLTPVGQRLMEYADAIFQIGQELQQELSTFAEANRSLRLGVTDAMPKFVVTQKLRPVFDEPGAAVKIVEGDIETLVNQLSRHQLDLVLTDETSPKNLGDQTYHHPLGSAGSVFMASPSLADKLRPGSPNSFHKAPFLVPEKSTAFGRALQEWLGKRDIQPDIVAEVSDSALIKVLGGEGLGVFVVPDNIADTVKARFGVEPLYAANDLRVDYFGITAARVTSHPLVRRLLAP